MIQLKPRPTFQQVAESHPEIMNEVDLMIGQACAEERRLTLEQVKQEFGVEIAGGMRGGDPHYSLYESLTTPTKVSLDKQHVLGYDKVYKEAFKLSESEELRQVYESFAGGDTTLPTQAGTILKKRQSEAELRLVQLITNSRYNTDSHLRNIVDNITRYICGKGIRIAVEDIQVEEALEDFLRQTRLMEMFSDFVRTTFKDAEGALLIRHKASLSTKKDIPGRVAWSVHKVFSEEIRAFETHSEDSGKKYAYLRQAIITDSKNFKVTEDWIADVEYFAQFNTRDNLIAFDGNKATVHDKLSKNKVIVWFQHGDKRELRGRVPIESILRDLRLLEDFKISRAILNYERSKVLYVKHERAAVNRSKSTTEVRKTASPKGGVQLNLGPNEKYEMVTASLNAGDANVDGMLFLYSIAAGVSIPVYILGMRADQQNYSAIKNTDSPFNQMISEYAIEYSNFLKKVWRWAIQINVEAGVLPKTVKIKRVAREKQNAFYKTMEKVYRLVSEGKKVSQEALDSLSSEYDAAMEDVEIKTIDIPVNTILADAIKPNPLENAKTAFIERKLGMVSSRTLSEMRGYNWAQELMRMLEEVSLGLWSNQTGQGQKDSSTATTGLDQGNAVDDGSGTQAQNSK